MLRGLFAAENMRRLELVSGLLGCAVALLSSLWVIWWSGAEAYLTVFAVELSLPAVLVATGVYLHVAAERPWARWLVWIGAAAALLESPGLLWMFPFTLSLLLVVISAVTSFDRRLNKHRAT